MSDWGSLLAGIGAVMGGLASVGTLLFMVFRGSDRENRRAATKALEASVDETVTPIERREREHG